MHQDEQGNELSAEALNSRDIFRVRNYFSWKSLFAELCRELKLARVWHRNGGARKTRWSMGSGFAAKSAASYCVRWLHDTVARLCAKFGAQRCTWNEIRSWSSMNPSMVDHVSEKSCYIFRMIKFRSRWVKRTVNLDNLRISMCQSETTIEFRACKIKGHITTF